MKRLSFILMALSMASGIAFAQQGESAVSVNLGYGSGSFHKAFKVGAEYKYNITDAIRIAPGFDYFFKSDGIGLWSANVNGHYLFDIKGAEGLKIYPLFGFTLLGTTGSADAGDYNPGDYLPDGYGDLFDEIYDDALEEAGGGNETRFGCNLGAGIQYPIAESIDLGFEIKYQFVKDFDQIVFGINAAYKF